MKQIFLKVYPNGKTSTNATVLNFDHEHNTGEIVIDFSEVSYLDWTKQLDLVFADGTHTFVEGTGNTLTVPLLESYLKKGSMTVQPLAKRLVGETYEKIKWQMVALSVRDSLNVLENDTSITPSIAEQWEIRIQAVEDAEVIRQSNEDTRIDNETTRILNENSRISNETGRVNAESTRVAQENARNVYESYNPLTPYVVGNKVSYNGSSYVCILDSLGNLPTNTTYWLLIASKGDKGNQWRGAYSGATSYVVDDVVSYNGSSYICILASLNNLPTNTTYFSLFAQKGDNTSADAVTNTPSGNISSTTVQGAINELDTEKADRLFATNLVTNGDFSNGTTGWTYYNAAISVDLTNYLSSPSSLRVESTGSAGHAQTNIVTIPNRKYYVSIYTLNGDTTSCIMAGYLDSGGNSRQFVVNLSGFSAGWTRVSTIYTATTNNLNLKLYPSYPSATTGYRYFDNLVVIDLTHVFGVGNEPTKEQMDWLLAQKYANSWFDGTKELTSITDLLTLVNTKANITQEAWITPTLLNGWASMSGRTVQYYKDNFGVVHWRGDLDATNRTSSAFCVVPVGYRPTRTEYTTLTPNSGGAYLSAFTDGNIGASGVTSYWQSLTILKYRTN